MTTVSTQELRDHIVRSSRILIVDDAETDRLILRNFCIRAGFATIIEAANAEEAWEMIGNQLPDLAFLDIEMPGLSGIDLCAKLRDVGLLQRMIVIIQTASDRSEIKAKAFDAGATDLISKPLHPRETIARMMAHLERRYLRHRDEEHYARIREELEEAVILQSILQPSDEAISEIVAKTTLDLAHYYHPATELAGDYLKVRHLGDDSVWLISIDIAGHGLAAALYSFAIHGLLEDSTLMTRSPAQVLTMLNEKLCGVMTEGKFATAFIARIRWRQQQIDYAAAASPMPIFLSSGKRVSLDTRGHLLGIDETVRYEEHQNRYQKGDCLLVYSDAMVETRDSGGEVLTPERIEQMLVMPHHPTAAEQMRQIIAGFYAHAAQPSTDDLSMILCRF